MKDTRPAMLRCGLIGKPLGHSYSPQIHAHLGGYEYRLIELEESEVGEFIKSDRYDAVNVTIPYKKTVMPFLDVISPEAQRIGSVNTVTHLPDGRIKGDNTDYYGFSYMLDKGKIDVKGKKVLVLGSGGASMTARTVAADRGARQIVVISRNGADNYTNIDRHADADIIMNTTPVGMYPNNGEKPLSLELFPSLSGVVDMIYNPSKTALILDAEERKIPCISGLYMLVAQAKAASEFFTGEKIDSAVIDEIVGKIEAETKNIMLVGMPGVGKTTVGKRIAQKLGRDFVDIDEEIVNRSGAGIPEIFREHGEEYFRELEHDVLSDFSKKSGLVISCGGGCVIRADNRRLMKQNSRVVFLKRDLSLLPKDGRPISQANDLGELYKKRLPFYLDAADVVFEMGNDPDENAEKITGEIGL
ncbi:MAG: shikimate kinase [Eubacteriales bacterium]